MPRTAVSFRIFLVSACRGAHAPESRILVPSTPMVPTWAVRRLKLMCSSRKFVHT